MKLKAIVLLLLFVLAVSNVIADELTEKLVQLKSLYSQGLITSDEYDKTKARLLNSLSPVGQSIHSVLKDSKLTVENAHIILSKNLMAVLPFYGNVYRDDVRQMLAKYTEKNVNKYIKRRHYDIETAFLDYDIGKRQLNNKLVQIDPDDPYTDKFLKFASEKLNVRYLFFGKIKNYTFDKTVYRFNVDCIVYDSVQKKIVFRRQARQSSRRKFFDGYVTKEEGKIIGKITEQFYFFINKLAKNPSMREFPVVTDK